MSHLKIAPLRTSPTILECHERKRKLEKSNSTILKPTFSKSSADVQKQLELIFYSCHLFLWGTFYVWTFWCGANFGSSSRAFRRVLSWTNKTVERVNMRNGGKRFFCFSQAPGKKGLRYWYWYSPQRRQRLFFRSMAIRENPDFAVFEKKFDEERAREGGMENDFFVATTTTLTATTAAATTTAKTTATMTTTVTAKQQQWWQQQQRPQRLGRQ